MLEVKNLTIKTIKSEKEIIKDLSFSVNKNDKLAIIGEEGNGKSTLLKCIYNQDLNPNMILLELGSQYSTIDEVLNTLELLAPIIAEYVNEI